MVDRLTRRERAAMALALECLRFDIAYQGHCDDEATTDVHAACAAMRKGLRGSLAWRLYAIVDAALGVAGTAYAAGEGRLIRARLALYLRARLRAERGERGRGSWVPTGARCGRVDHRVDAQGRCGWRSACGCWRRTRRITPLWQQAPAHGHWRHGCGGRPVDLPRGEPCGECGECGARRAGR